MRSLAVACVVALVAANAAGGAPEFFHTDGAWAMLKDGGVRTWGDPGRGGDSSSVRDMSGVDMSGIEHGVQSVVATKSAFAALKADGSVISWGKASEGGDSRVNLDSVVKLAASAYAFAALRADGGVVFWGKLSADESEADEGNDGNAAQHSLEALKPLEPSHSQGDAEADEALQDLEELDSLDSLDSGVVDVIASSEAFACIKEDGTVYTWDGDLLKKVYDGDNPVVEVFGGLSSFAALRKDGSVLTWGHPEFGGDSSAVRSHLQSGVLRLERRSIFDRGFIAWKANSTAVIWGHNKKGVPLESQIVRAEQVQLRHTAGAVLRPDGTAFCFGDPKTFGDSSSVDLSNLRSILCPRFACVAIKKDGSIVTWGQRLGRQDPPELQNVVEVFGTPYSFAALIRDTSDIPRPNDRIVAWGDSQSGGRTDYPKKLPRHLEVFEVKAIHSHFDGSNNGVFIAEVRDQDSRDVLHAWGDPRYGALVADVSERSSERSQRSLQTTAPCLSSAVMTRKNVVNGNGDAISVRIMDPGWESVKILSRIAKVVIEEVLGYNAELHEGFNTVAAIFPVMAGCTNYPYDWTGCSAGSTESRVLMEGYIWQHFDVWSSVTLYTPAFAPVRASKIYRSYEGLYVSKGVWDLKTTSPALDTKEAFLSSQNPHDYFDDLTAFSSTQLAPCSQTILMDRTIMATYVQITDDRGCGCFR